MSRHRSQSRRQTLASIGIGLVLECVKQNTPAGTSQTRAASDGSNRADAMTTDPLPIASGLGPGLALDGFGQHSQQRRRTRRLDFEVSNCDETEDRPSPKQPTGIGGSLSLEGFEKDPNPVSAGSRRRQRRYRYQAFRQVTSATDFGLALEDLREHLAPLCPQVCVDSGDGSRDANDDRPSARNLRALSLASSPGGMPRRRIRTRADSDGSSLEDATMTTALEPTVRDSCCLALVAACRRASDGHPAQLLTAPMVLGVVPLQPDPLSQEPRCPSDRGASEVPRPALALQCREQIESPPKVPDAMPRRRQSCRVA